jgi:hypothetical protein
VTVSPHDVYTLTWKDAHRELVPPPDPLSGSMGLYADPQIKLLDGVEAVWVINYYNDSQYLTYRIDAQTGKILEKIKEPR